jgi:hypothetical protein
VFYITFIIIFEFLCVYLCYFVPLLAIYCYSGCLAVLFGMFFGVIRVRTCSVYHACIVGLINECDMVLSPNVTCNPNVFGTPNNSIH